MKHFLLNIFLIFKYIVISSCQYSSNMDEFEQGLVFVFDTTNSMADDLEYFKKGSDIILDTISSDPDMPITDYVLVPFNDPDFGPAMISKDKEDLRSAVKNIKIYNVNNRDCDELCFSGLKLALETSLISSYIYVMTDAAAKDVHLENDIINLVQRRRSQVVFLVGKGCHQNGFEKYDSIAQASSGQVFLLDGAEDIYKVLEYTNKTLSKDRVDISYVINSRGDFEHEVLVDDSLKSFSAVVSGGTPKLEIVNPEGNTVSDQSIVEKIIDLAKVKAVEVKNPTVGVWLVKYGSNEQHSLKVSGVSKLKFGYGFSATKTTSMSETTNRPLLGVNNSVLIQIKTGENNVQKLLRVQIVDFSEKILHDLELQFIENALDSNLYKSEEFQMGDDLFYLIINGLDKSGNTLKRTSRTAIQVQKPEKPYVSIKSLEKLNITNDEVVVNMYDEFSLFCDIDSLIPANATWSKNDKQINDWNFEQSGNARLTMHIIDKSYEGEYKCKVSNMEGIVEKTIKIKVTGETTDKPPIGDNKNGQDILRPQFYLISSYFFITYLNKYFIA